MAKTKPTDNQEGNGPLDDFTWDSAGGSEDFFGVKGSGVTKQTQQSAAEEAIRDIIGDDEDDDDGTTTKIDDDKKGKKKPKKEEVVNDDDVEFNFGAEPKKPSKKKPEPEPEEEDDEDEEVDEDEDEVEEGDEDEDEDDDEETPKKDKKTKVKAEATAKAKPKADTSNQTDGQFYHTLATEMVDNKIFQHAKLPEGKEELTIDEFFDLQNDEVEGRVQETFEAFAEEMDDDGKEFIKFKKDGGRTIDFLNVFVNSPLPDFGEDNFDPAKESHRKEVIQTYLALVDKMDAEEIDDRITWLKEQGKDQTYAEKYYNKLVDIDAKQKKLILQKQTEIAARRAEDAKAYVDSINKLVAKTTKAGQFKITKEDQKKLAAFITKPTVKVGKNQFIPEFNSKLGEIIQAKTPEAQQKLVLLAKLLSNDFDFSDIEKGAETKVTKKVKSNLRNAKNGVRPSSSGQYGGSKTLSDFFE